MRICPIYESTQTVITVNIHAGITHTHTFKTDWQPENEGISLYKVVSSGGRYDVHVSAGGDMLFIWR